MEEETSFFSKKIISGIVLLVLLASLPFIYYLVTKTQVFKPKASTYDIDIVPKAGVSVIQENGSPVIQTTMPDEFKIKITSPIDTSKPSSDAGFSVIKPAYAASYLTLQRPAPEQRQSSPVTIDWDSRTIEWFCHKETNTIVRKYYEGLIDIGQYSFSNHQVCSTGSVCQSKAPVDIKGRSVPDAECVESAAVAESTLGQLYSQQCDISPTVKGTQTCQRGSSCSECKVVSSPGGTVNPVSRGLSPVVVPSQGEPARGSGSIPARVSAPAVAPAVAPAPAPAVDEFADHSLDGKRSAYTCAEGPQDAEKPAGQYQWKADCSRKCMYNEEKGPGDPAGCPKNNEDLYVNPATSNWCYGFKDGNRCMQLKWTGAPARRSTTAVPAGAQPQAPTQQQPAAPASAAPAAPATPANPATPAAPAQPNTAGRSTTHYRVRANESSFNAWDTYTSGGVILHYGFPSSQPGKKVFLYIQFKDNFGTIFNANPYPIEIRYVASSPNNPTSTGRTCPVSATCCTQDLKTCSGNGIDASCPAGYQWCYKGYCVNGNYNQSNNTCPATATGGSALPACRTTTACGQTVTGDSCTQSCDGTRAKYDCKQADNPNCLGSVYCSTDDNKCGGGSTGVNAACGATCGGCPTKDTCGNRTYDTCDTRPCSAAGATANTTFKCYAKDSPNNCVGEYLCGSVCAGSVVTPTTAAPTTTPPTTNTGSGVYYEP